MFPSEFLRRPFTLRQWSSVLVVACMLPAIVATALLIYFSFSISWLIAGALLLFALGLVLAYLIGGRIGASIRALVAPVMALGHGQPVAIPALVLREAHEVGQVLLQASELLRQRTAERDQAERAEQDMRESRQQLEQSEFFLRGIFEETPDAVFLIAPDGRIARANAEAERLFGYTQDQLAALLIDDLLSDGGSETQKAWRKGLFEIRARRAIGDGVQLRARRADATEFPVDLTVSPFRKSGGGLVIATVRDVSGRERTAQELSVVNHRLALATLAGGIAVWEWNLVTDELVWDARMHALYKVPEENASGKFDMWRRCVHPDDLERAERELREALAGGKDYATEFRIIWPDGQTRMIRANAIATRDAGGKPLRVTGVNIDITETRRKEELISAALREKETLLKELYHRVKNNLQVIASLFNLQVRALPEGAARSALIESVGRVRAMGLAHEKLYQSGDLSSVAFAAYVTELCTQLGRAASSEQRGIALSTEVVQLQIGLDRAVPLGLLLNELISNSLKHAFPEGRGGRIVVRVEREDGGMVRLCVIDNGIGLPHGIDPATSHSLGLKLVAALSHQIAGSLTLESGDGTTACITFPLEDRPAASAQSGDGE